MVILSAISNLMKNSPCKGTYEKSKNFEKPTLLEVKVQWMKLMKSLVKAVLCQEQVNELVKVLFRCSNRSKCRIFLLIIIHHLHLNMTP
jgi:hypothetical protein